jgi:hypothetical protein
VLGDHVGLTLERAALAVEHPLAASPLGPRPVDARDPKLLGDGKADQGVVRDNGTDDGDDLGLDERSQRRAGQLSAQNHDRRIAQPLLRHTRAGMIQRHRTRREPTTTSPR